MSLARPLVWTTGAVVLGTLSGLGAGGATAFPPWLAPVAAGLAVLLALRAPERRRLAWIGVLLLALGFLRGFLAAPRAATVPVDPASLEHARDEVVIGRWRPHGGRTGLHGSRRGWLDPGAETATAGHRLLFDLPAPGSAPGAWLAVLPGGDVTPWPRGPEPGPRARDGRFLASSRVHPDELVRLADRPQLELVPRGLAQRLRELLIRRTAALEGTGASQGLLRALVAGDRRGLPAGRTDLFTRTGTRHLLALSGLHVGLFFAFVLLPLTLLVRRRRLRFGLRIVVLGVYTVSVGAGDPVTRASVALVLAHLAPLLPVRLPARGARPELGRHPDALSIGAFVLLLECLVAPVGLLSLSLLLSYTATLGLLLGTRPLSELLFPLPRRARPVAGIHSLGWTLRRVLLVRVLGTGVRGVAASAAAVLATLPLTWSAFGEWSPIGLVLTPLCLPLIAALMASAWLGILVPAVGSLALFSGLLEGLAGALVALLEVADGFPGTPAPLPLRPTWLLAGLVGASFVALRTRRMTRPVLAAWCLVLLPWSSAPAGLELFALDVGHGSAVVLRAPGVPALIFDAGSRDRRGLDSEALAPLLRRWEVAHVAIALSHDHGDHRSALPWLAERFPPRLYLGPRPAQWPERLAHDVLFLDALQGQNPLSPSPPGVPLELVWRRGSELPGNEGSRALEVRWRGERLLLCGDAEEEGLAGILAQEVEERPLRLLLYPHHGSDSSLAGRLLGRRPGEIWVSNGSMPAVGAEIERRGLRWRWTGRDGPLALFLP